MPFHVVIAIYFEKFKSKISFSLFADSPSVVVPGSTPEGEIFFCWFGPFFIFHYPTMPPCRAAGLWLWTCKPEEEAHTCGPDGRQAWTGSLNRLFPVTWFSAASIRHSAFHPSHTPMNTSRDLEHGFGEQYMLDKPTAGTFSHTDFLWKSKRDL